MKRWGLMLGICLAVNGFCFPSLAAKGTSPHVLYTGEKYREPTLSPLSVNPQTLQEEKPAPLPPLDVQGIIWGKAEPQAIVNNRIVVKGDLLEGVKILEISQKGVHVFFKGTSHFLRPGGHVEESK